MEKGVREENHFYKHEIHKSKCIENIADGFQKPLNTGLQKMRACVFIPFVQFALSHFFRALLLRFSSQCAIHVKPRDADRRGRHGLTISETSDRLSDSLFYIFTLLI